MDVVICSYQNPLALSLAHILWNTTGQTRVRKSKLNELFLGQLSTFRENVIHFIPLITFPVILSTEAEAVT